MSQKYDLMIDTELRDLLPNPSRQTDEQLEASLRASGGPIDPITIWKGTKIIVDGHRRYGICQRLLLPYQVREMEFADREAAKQWMRVYQLCRRNLPPAQEAIQLAAAVEYERKHGAGIGEALKKVSDAAGVSTRTTRRAIATVENLDKIAPEVASRIKAGELTASQADIKTLATLPQDEQVKVAAEVDQGAYKNLHEALCGEGSQPTGPRETDRGPEVDSLSQNDEPATKAKPAKPVGDYLDNAIVHIGKAAKSLDYANDGCAHAEYRPSIKLLQNISERVTSWKESV